MMSREKPKKTEKTNISKVDITISEADSNVSAAIDNVGENVEPILQQVAGDMSEPSSGIDADNIQARIDAMSQTDKSGNVFDPAIHATGNDGEPVLTAKGNYRRKRKSTEPVETTSRKAAEYSTIAFVQLGVALFGDEWLPVNSEKDIIVTAFDDYYIEQEITNIPAWLGLAIALGGFSIKRFTQPVTKTKLGKVKTWFTDKIKNARNRIKPRNAAVSRQDATEEIRTN